MVCALRRFEFYVLLIRLVELNVASEKFSDLVNALSSTRGRHEFVLWEWDRTAVYECHNSVCSRCCVVEKCEWSLPVSQILNYLYCTRYLVPVLYLTGYW